MSWGTPSNNNPFYGSFQDIIPNALLKNRVLNPATENTKKKPRKKGLKLSARRSMFSRLELPSIKG